MVGRGAERRRVGWRGDAGFGSLQSGGEAVVPLALFVGLGPGQAVGFGDAGDRARGLDRVEGLLDLWFGLGGFWLGSGGLEFVQAALSFV